MKTSTYKETKDHPAAVALRDAAVKWTECMMMETWDPADAAFRKVDRGLLSAAVRYSAVAEHAERA